jgi:uncharacterized membrane protein YozB (DUF420 family)
MNEAENSGGRSARSVEDRFRTRPLDHRFFGFMAVGTASVILIGFAASYGPKVLAGGSGLPAIIHVHAAVFSCWLALFVLQVVLVARGRVALHQRLGTPGVLLAGVMLVLGGETALVASRLGHRGIPGVEFPAADGFLLLNLTSILSFSILVGAAWYFRRSAQAHKRIMLLAMVGGLAPPGIARLPAVSGHTPAIAGVVLVFLLIGPIYDLFTRKRVHPSYLWAFLPLILTAPPVVTAFSATEAWHRVAAWLMG